MVREPRNLRTTVPEPEDTFSGSATECYSRPLSALPAITILLRGIEYGKRRTEFCD